VDISIGRIVLYTLTLRDAEDINLRRTHSELSRIASQNSGAQVHVGNTVREGSVFPLVVTAVWNGGQVSGQVLLDGNDNLWVKSVKQNDGDTLEQPGTWAWPVQV
jgi:hypothetical protein